MAGLTHLKDIYDNKGIKFVEKLFSSDVLITEKIDGARFAFENTGEEVLYYKRNPNKPISIIDRTVMKYYEPAISHIESLSESKLTKGIRFGCEYFATKNPGSIVYDKKPKNGLILTDVSKGGSMITDIDVLERYSRQLGIMPPPVIYDGKMSNTQKKQLIEFLETPWEDLYKKFETTSFTAYIISILNPKLKSTALNLDINKPIEGIVFSFNDGKTRINAKVVDPLYTQKARKMARARHNDQQKRENELSKEFMKKLLQFFRKYDFSTVELEQKGREKRYLELLSKVFKEFVKKNKSVVAKLPSEPTSAYDNEMLDVNYNFIFDDELKNMIKSDDKLKFGYKKFLQSFGRTRKRGNRVLDKGMVSDVNSLIKTIQRLAENSNSMYSHLLILQKRDNLRKM